MPTTACTSRLSDTTLVGTAGDRIFLGSAPAGHEWTGFAEAFQGLLVRRDGETVYQMNLAAGN